MRVDSGSRICHGIAYKGSSCPLIAFLCLMHAEEEKGEGRCLLVLFTRLHFFRLNVCLLLLQQDTKSLYPFIQFNQLQQYM